MKALLFIAIVFTNPLAWAQSHVTVKHKDLLGIQETIFVENVNVAGIGPMPEPATISNPTAIRLLITGNSACGDSFFVNTNEKGVLTFHQVGWLGGHIQPACKETIEYFWAPGDYEMEDGQRKQMSLKIGPVVTQAGRQKDLFVNVTTTVTQRTGKFPGGGGSGRYFVYSNVKVSGLKKKRTPLPEDRVSF